MAVTDLTDFLAGSGQEYPNVPSRDHPAGKTYRVPSPDAETGLLLASLGNLGAMSAVGAKLSVEDVARIKFDDAGERDFYRLVLGCSKECRERGDDEHEAAPCASVYHEMLGDGVPWDWFETIAQHAYMAFAFDDESAQRYLDGPGKATPVPNRSDKRAAAKAGQKSGRASGATATRTRPRASTGSSSRTASPAKAKATSKTG